MNTIAFDCLNPEDRLSFSLYAASREIIKHYKPFLDRLDLTYTQYLTMALLWKAKSMTVKEIGDALYLDSGTLTPLLKKLEAKGYLTRIRSTTDERNLNVSVTENGMQLREIAQTAAEEMGKSSPFTDKEEKNIYFFLEKVLEKAHD